MLSRFHTPKPTANMITPVVKKVAMSAFFFGGMRSAASVYFRIYMTRITVVITMKPKTS